ncbi:MAG TPA: trehalose-6-phosphate synthase [Acidimicrobiales bacterium]|nr:trehalose-6-phosphate synthase [Acidimicrobiales bacterium]
MAPAVVLASNRGPISFQIGAGGDLETKRGGGGLIVVVGGALEGTDALWIASALSDADREAASRGVIEAEGYRVRTIVAEGMGGYYDVISNSTLWFLYHGLFDAPRRPRFDRAWRAAWDEYRSVNHAYARAIAEDAPDGAVVLVQDYHLSLVPAALRELRSDVRVVHFHHTPFAGPDALRMLPTDVATELLSGLAGATACGFHDARWADAFTASCQALIGVTPRTFVAPAAADAADIQKVAASDACDEQLRKLEAQIGDRKLLVRVDRIELSKNIARGFLAFDDLLRTYPEWRERVVFGAFVYPSREGLAEYLAYRQEVEGLIRRINEEWSTPSWTPILYDARDDFPRSVAALRRYDVLLVNPVRDGLNLVAKEGPIVNERNGVLALSRESGVNGELGGLALEVNPFDVAGTAEVLHHALSMSADDRAAHASAVRERAAARTPHDWFADQLAAAERG